MQPDLLRRIVRDITPEQREAAAARSRANPDPERAREWAELRASVLREATLTPDGSLSLRARVAHQEAMQALLDAMREELGLADPAILPPERAQSRWRPRWPSRRRAGTTNPPPPAPTGT